MKHFIFGLLASGVVGLAAQFALNYPEWAKALDPWIIPAAAQFVGVKPSNHYATPTPAEPVQLATFLEARPSELPESGLLPLRQPALLQPAEAGAAVPALEVPTPNRIARAQPESPSPSDEIPAAPPAEEPTTAAVECVPPCVPVCQPQRRGLFRRR